MSCKKLLDAIKNYQVSACMDMVDRQLGPPVQSFQLDSDVWGPPQLWQLYGVTKDLILVEFNGGELALVSTKSGEIVTRNDSRSLLGGNIGLSVSSNLSAGLLIRAVESFKTPIFRLPELALEVEIKAQYGNTPMSAKFSPCGQYLAIGYGRYPLGIPEHPIDSVVEIWSLQKSPEFVTWQRMPGVACSAIAWNADSSFLAVFSGNNNQKTGYLALIETNGWNISQICETRLGMMSDAFVGWYSVILFGFQGWELRSWMDLGNEDDASILEVENSPGNCGFGPGGFVFTNGSLVSIEKEEAAVLPKSTVCATTLLDGGVASLSNESILQVWPSGKLDIQQS